MIFYSIGYLLTNPQVFLGFPIVTPTLVSDWESSDVSAEHKVFPENTETIAWAPFRSHPTRTRSLPALTIWFMFALLLPMRRRRFWEEGSCGGAVPRVSWALCRGRSRVPLTLRGLYWQPWPGTRSGGTAVCAGPTSADSVSCVTTRSALIT